MNGAEGTVKITVFVVRTTPSEGGAEYVYEAAAELQQRGPTRCLPPTPTTLQNTPWGSWSCA